MYHTGTTDVNYCVCLEIEKSFYGRSSSSLSRYSRFWFPCVFFLVTVVTIYFLSQCYRKGNIYHIVQFNCTKIIIMLLAIASFLGFVVDEFSIFYSILVAFYQKIHVCSHSLLSYVTRSDKRRVIAFPITQFCASVTS